MDHQMVVVDGRCVECGKPVHAFRGGLRHRWREPEDVEARFWRFVRKGDVCWEWTGHRTAAGWHGRFAVKATRPPVKVVAHRFSWELHYGLIPAGMEVCHRCDNPPCVRPDHLFLGTHQENMRDAGDKGRTRPQTRDWSMCKRGHEMTGANVYVSPSTGRRRCRTCVHDRNALRYIGQTPESLRSAADKLEGAMGG